MPFFSVIIPSFNRAHILTRTIASVIAQSFSDWECIIVDDGSTDNTKELIASYKDTRIRYVYQQNAERSAARNNGIRHAQGKYICFLDSDDEYLPEHLETLYKKISQNQSPAMYFVNAVHKIQGEIKFPVYPQLNSETMEYVFREPIIPARVCVHSLILKYLKFDEDIVIVEDLVLWTRIASEYPVYHFPEYSVIYHIHPDNSVNLKNNSYLKRYKGLKTFIGRYPEIVKKISKENLDCIMSNTVFGIAKYNIYKRSRTRAINRILQSIYYHPLNAMTLHKVLLILSLIGLYSKKLLEEYQ